jgi:hypothetical protein
MASLRWPISIGPITRHNSVFHKPSLTMSIRANLGPSNWFECAYIDGMTPHKIMSTVEKIHRRSSLKNIGRQLAHCQVVQSRWPIISCKSLFRVLDTATWRDRLFADQSVTRYLVHGLIGRELAIKRPDSISRISTTRRRTAAVLARPHAENSPRRFDVLCSSLSQSQEICIDPVSQKTSHCH